MLHKYILEKIDKKKRNLWKRIKRFKRKANTYKWNYFVTFTYDSQNNVQKTGLTYTNGKLTSVNGTQIVYDAMGNPTKYKGNTFTWEQGRKLASGTMNGNSFSYAYDGNGMRYEKVVNGEKTNYYYDGSQLLMESKDGQRIWYVYGVTGIEGMIYDESCYYFDKNTLGDVIAIRDNNGNIVGVYEYDAWGNITYQYGSIASVNPFRYRGYYYDTETGFYYLQTRYYDPTICRFINADNYELISQLASSKELNMYAYCGNNPIMYTDPTGEIVGWAIILIGAGIGALIGGIIGGTTASNNGAEGWEVVGGISLGVAIGAAGGALATAGGTAFVAGVRGALQLTVNIALVKETVALGLAVSNTIGAILGPLLGLDWQLVEWGPSSPDVLPNKNPYSDVSGMKSNTVIGGNAIANFYTV